MKTLSLSPSPRIASAPAPARPHPVQEQEATTAASRLSHDFTSLPVQTKLAVNTPGDEYEREADDVAERVMRMPAAPPNIQRKCAECEEEEESSVQASQSSGELEKDEEEPAAAAQGAEGFSQEEEFVADQAHIFRKASVNAPPAFATASSSPAPVAASLREGGLPLPSAARRHMEAAFGRDFSQVRVHHDSAAADTSRQLSALAFTHRNHIHFASGMFNPGASSGKRLLAHELT
ncbi:MAG: DUF4157 domain-containing protein, partial [Candidatus Solibacter sp.]